MSDTGLAGLWAKGTVHLRAKPAELRQAICARLSRDARLEQNSPRPASAEGSDRKKFGQIRRGVSPPDGKRAGRRLEVIIDTAVMLSGALQRNAKHEARLSNISGRFCSGNDPKLIRASSLCSK